MQAVVLAAGEGQRLKPFTVNKPKVMIKVANKPILEYVIEALRDAGILDIILVVGYKKSRIMDYFGNGEKWGVNIKYAIQEKQLGTAHALKQAERLVNTEKFLVLPGDNIVDPSTIKLMKNAWTLACKRSKEYSKYGVVTTVGERIQEIIEKPGKPIGEIVSTGIYCFTKEIFKKIGNEVDLTSVVNSMIKEGYEFRCSDANVWVDIVYPWDILKVNDFAMTFSGKKIAGKVERTRIIGDVCIGDNSIIKDSYIKGPVIIGDNCEVGPNSVIMPSTSIGNNVRIGAFAYIENSVIGDHVSIAPRCFIKDSVIDKGCEIGPNFVTMSDRAEIKVEKELHSIKVGVFIGESCKIGASVTVEPGSVVGNEVLIASLKLVKGTILDKTVIM